MDLNGHILIPRSALMKKWWFIPPMFQDTHKSTLLSYPKKLISLVLWLLSAIYAFADRSSIEFEEITVTPGQFTIQEGTRSALSLSKREVGLYPLIDNDIMRAAQIFPGVVSNDFSARFSVRGSEKDEILVKKYIDRIKQNIFSITNT